MSIVKPIPLSLRFLILPGWQNSGPDHWQSRWEALYGFERVEQADWDWPRRGDWMARLDEVLLQLEEPAVLVAHSLGCQLATSWAEHSQHTARVAAALLVAPPDTEREDIAPQLHNWRPIRRSKLPFPALAAISSDDPFCTPERATQMAADWGASVCMLGAFGHVNSKSGLGDWPQGKALLDELVQRR